MQPPEGTVGLWVLNGADKRERGDTGKIWWSTNRYGVASPAHHDSRATDPEVSLRWNWSCAVSGRIASPYRRSPSLSVD